MGKNNRNNTPKKEGNSNWHMTALLCMSCAMGVIPPPPGRDLGAWFKRTEQGILRAMMRHMGSKGQVLIDPELPDTYLSIVLAVLLPTFNTVGEYTAAMEKLSIVTDAAASPDGTAPGTTQAELEAAQTWQQNTADWWQQTWSGDWDEGRQSWSEGWQALLDGNFS